MAAPAPARPSTGNRKAFRRTKVSLVERISSLVIVLLLAGIAVAIWWKGRHFDPSRFQPRTDALKSTVADVAGKAGTVPETGNGAGETPAATVAASAASESTGGAEGGESGGTTTPAPAAKGQPLEINLAGLKPMGDTEFYNADNLFEKIDGRAPAYLNFNFQSLRCRSFSIVGTAGSYVDVYEYRFDTPVNAFGMFALERDPQGQPLTFAPDGYLSGMGLFFRQGPYYVQVLGSDLKPQTLELARAIAENCATNLPVDNTGLDARRRLPVTGLDPASVQFVQENAQGQEFLKNVFQASYNFAGKKLPFFVMMTTPADAAKAWTAYRDFAGQFGGQVTALADVNGAQVFAATNFGTWKVIYQRAGELGGVYDADDEQAARQFVQKYLEGQIK